MSGWDQSVKRGDLHFLEKTQGRPVFLRLSLLVSVCQEGLLRNMLSVSVGAGTVDR